MILAVDSHARKIGKASIGCAILRQAKARFAELLQLYGGHHRRLEERGPKGCLMNPGPR